MHEISLCENIRGLLEEQAREQRFGRVTRVWLEVGPFSCVEPEALRFGFAAVMQGSVAEDAELNIDTTPGKAFCEGCRQTVRIAQRYDACPICGVAGLRVTRGEELRVSKLEVV